MKAFTRPGTLAALLVLAFLLNPDITRAQNYRGCAWPLGFSSEGSGDTLAPDTASRLWLMPFDNYDTMTIKGTYPDARYFSFTAYDTDSSRFVHDIAGGLYDAQIAADSNSYNSFVKQGSGKGAYTLVISRTGQTSGNTIGVSSNFAWIVYRVYVPNDRSLSGRSLMGGVLPPAISVTKNGVTQELDTCSPPYKLKDVIAFLQTVFPSGIDLKGSEGTPSSDRLWFAPPTKPPLVLLPNPDNKYIGMFPGDKYQPGRIIVIRGKAPGFPGTFDGQPIWKPARGFESVDVRFWSMCNYDLALPVPVVGCVADVTANLENGYYNVVISDDLIRPDWLRPNIDWLPWGDEQYPKTIFMRNMLAAASFAHSIQQAIASGCTFNFDFPTLPDRGPVDTAGQCAQQSMGDYYPVAAWCDKSKFIAGGVKACLDERSGNRKK